MAYATFPVYNLDAPVGRRVKGSTEDANLIRALLNLAIEKPAVKTAMRAAVIDNKLGNWTGFLHDKGGYDEHLQLWIDAFQYVAKKHLGSNNPVDGRIDPLPASKDGLTVITTRGGGTCYTLSLLNQLALSENSVRHERIGKLMSLGKRASVLNRSVYSFVW
ncbi:MAG: hypothetical protein IT162_02155 [Bryobacterales bacterium]|nr:hypothetical protein [Bryobacterales bacterium]